MKRLICIELLQTHAKASFYVVRFKDDSASEFEKFIDKFSGKSKFQNNIQELVYWMDTIGKMERWTGTLDMKTGRLRQYLLNGHSLGYTVII